MKNVSLASIPLHITEVINKKTNHHVVMNTREVCVAGVGIVAATTGVVVGSGVLTYLGIGAFVGSFLSGVRRGMSEGE